MRSLTKGLFRGTCWVTDSQLVPAVFGGGSKTIPFIVMLCEDVGLPVSHSVEAHDLFVI